MITFGYSDAFGALTSAPPKGVADIAADVSLGSGVSLGGQRMYDMPMATGFWDAASSSRAPAAVRLPTAALPDEGAQASYMRLWNELLDSPDYGCAAIAEPPAPTVSAVSADVGGKACINSAYEVTGNQNAIRSALSAANVTNGFAPDMSAIFVPKGGASAFPLCIPAVSFFEDPASPTAALTTAVDFSNAATDLFNKWQRSGERVNAETRNVNTVRQNCSTALERAGEVDKDRQTPEWWARGKRRVWPFYTMLACETEYQKFAAIDKKDKKVSSFYTPEQVKATGKTRTSDTKAAFLKYIDAPTGLNKMLPAVNTINEDLINKVFSLAADGPNKEGYMAWVSGKSGIKALNEDFIANHKDHQCSEDDYYNEKNERSVCCM